MADNSNPQRPPQQPHQQHQRPQGGTPPATIPPEQTPPIGPIVDTLVAVNFDGPRKPVEERYRELLIELILDVSNGAQLTGAKKILYAFVDDCNAEEKTVMLSKITSVSQRIRDIAQALAGESPSLIAKLQGD